MKRRVLNLLNEQQQVIKVQQSPNVGTDLLGSPTSFLCPPCTLPTFKCVEPQPLVLPINCPLPQRPIIPPPPPPRISCPPPTICPPPQPCPAPPTCPRPAPCPLPPPPRRPPPPPPMPFPLPIPPKIICPPRGNIFATTISAQNDCCCNCGIRSCLVLPSNTLMQKRHFLATFGTRTHSRGNDLPFNIFDNILGDTIASFMNDNDNAKCNSEMLRKIILEVKSNPAIRCPQI
uniref:Uncharacterized protein n=1 Tax=Meloidogyne incognita TaxID=6306 RepID=A0A914KQZ1_MELIC